MEPRSKLHSRRLAILDDTATFQQYGLRRTAKPAANKVPKHAVREWADDVATLEPLIFAYPQFNEEQKIRLKIMVKREIDRQMLGYRKKLEKQLAASAATEIFKPTVNALRFKTAIMVYRQRHINLRVIEKDQHQKLIAHSKMLSGVFFPNSNDSLPFRDLGPKQKWKRVFREKHWKAFSKDPDGYRRGKKTSGDFHPYRVDLPFREQDIRLWKDKLAQEKREQGKPPPGGTSRGKEPKKSVAQVTNENFHARPRLSLEDGDRREKVLRVPKSPEAQRRKQIAAFQRRYILGQSNANVPLLGDNVSLIKHYSIDDGKNLTDDVRDRARRMRNARPVKHCVSPDVTLLVHEGEYARGSSKPPGRLPGAAAAATNGTSSYMSPDCIPVPFVLADRVDDHIKAVPALPFTRFVQTSLLQTVEALVEAQRETTAERNVSSPEPEEDAGTSVTEAAEAPADVPPPVVAEAPLGPELMEKIYEYRAGGIWTKLKEMVGPFENQAAAFKSDMYNRHMNTKTVSNPLVSMNKAHLLVPPEYGEYPPCLYRIDQATDDQLHSFRVHVTDTVLHDSVPFQPENHTIACAASTHALVVASHLKKAGRTPSQSAPRPGAKRIVALTPLTIERFKSAGRMLGLGKFEFLKTASKYTSSQWSPWATNASKVWLRASEKMYAFRRACQHYIQMECRMPKKKRKKHMLILRTQMEAIEILRTECSAFVYFLFVQLSDFTPAWAIHCSVNTLLESVSEEELLMQRKKRNQEQKKKRKLLEVVERAMKEEAADDGANP